MQLQDDLSSEFDHFSANYTADMTRLVPHYQALLLAMVDRIPSDFKATRILDLGCGNGNCTARLLKRFPKGEYNFVDASAEMLRHCQKRFPTINARYHQSYFQELSFPENSFDLIVAGFSLHHLKGPEKQPFFKQARSWLTPNGLLTFSDLMIDRNNEAIHAPFLREWQRFTFDNQSTPAEWEWLMDHYNTYDFPDDAQLQLQWLENAGFASAKITWQADHYWTSIAAYP